MMKFASMILVGAAVATATATASLRGKDDMSTAARADESVRRLDFSAGVVSADFGEDYGGDMELDIGGDMGLDMGGDMEADDIGVSDAELGIMVDTLRRQFRVRAGSCNLEGLIEGLKGRVRDVNALLNDLGIDEDTVSEACAETLDSYEFLPFREVFDENDYQYVKEYFDGNEEPNEERETRDNDFYVTKEMLKYGEIGMRINSIYRRYARRHGIEFPEEQVVNFEECQFDTVMCCWAQDRQANDDNGNCAKQYDTNCVDKDPADNTDICYVDMENSPESNRVAGGFAIYEGDTEGDTHCHGFAWTEEGDYHPSRFFRGNNLFYVSAYDHLYQRGYVRNIDGAPMCGCLEQMPVVSRSDCTQMDVRQTFLFSFRQEEGLGAQLHSSQIAFNACTGAGGNNNDLRSHFELLVDQGLASQEDFDEVKKVLVEDCSQPTLDFLSTQGITPSAQGANPNSPAPTDVEFETILQSGVGRRMYAQAGKNWGDGYGASPPRDPNVYADQHWIFSQTDCPGGQETICFVIQNKYSDRRIFAQDGKNWEDGVGASPGGDPNVYDDQKWYLRAKDDGVYWIVNSYSERYMYTGAGKAWREGVGALNRQEDWLGHEWHLQNVPEEILPFIL